MGSKRSIACHCIFSVALLSAGGVVAGDAKIATGVVKAVNVAPIEGCVVNASVQAMQDIKNMAKKFGPEAALDMMFSSVTPFFQAALLTKSADPAKPVRDIAGMRDDKYFQYAITTTNVAAPWVKVTTDGRVYPAVSTQIEVLHATGWLRSRTYQDKNKAVETDGRKSLDQATAAVWPRRY
jgi:hypothetical protein